MRAGSTPSVSGVVGEPPKCRVTVLDRCGMRMFGGDPVVHHQHRHAGCGDVVAHRQVIEAAEMLKAEDHAAAVQIQHRTAGLTRRRVVPVEVQRGAVRGRQRVPVDLHTGDRFPRGCDIVEHPVAVDPPGLDVADRRRLGLTDGLQQWTELRQHLRVDTECHGPDSNVDACDQSANRHLPVSAHHRSTQVGFSRSRPSPPYCPRAGLHPAVPQTGHHLGRRAGCSPRT